MKDNIGKMYLFQFFFGMYFIGGVLVPFFTEWGGLSFRDITLLQAWFVFWMFALEVPTGAVADYFGRKVSIIIGCVAFILGIIVYGIAPRFELFLIGEFLWALSRALISGADGAVVYDTLLGDNREGDSKKIFGRFRSFFLVGMAVGSPIGSVIAHFIGLREVLFFMILPATLALAVSLTLNEPKRGYKKTADFLANKTSPYKILTVGVRYFWNHKIIKILATDQIIVWTMIFMMLWIYQVVLKELGVGIIYFGIVHAIILLVQIISLNRLDFMERVLGSKKRYIFVSALVPALGLIILAFTHWAPAAIFLIVLIMGLGLPRRVILENYMHKHIDSDKRATVISTVSMFRSGFQAICYPIIGLMVDWSLWTSIFILGIIVFVVAFASRVKDEHLID